MAGQGHFTGSCIGSGFHGVKWKAGAPLSGMWTHGAESHVGPASGQKTTRVKKQAGQKGQRINEHSSTDHMPGSQDLYPIGSCFLSHFSASLLPSPSLSFPSFPLYSYPPSSPTIPGSHFCWFFLHITFLLLVSKQEKPYAWQSGPLPLNLHHKTRKSVQSRLQITESHEGLLLAQHPQLLDLIPGPGH